MKAFRALFILLLCAAPAFAQDDAAESRTAFSLSTSETFTTKDSPHFYLTFRRLTQLDFRVYKVRDPFAFFAGLDDPHQVGSGEAIVEQERTWIERFADWKREQRQRVHRFARAQASHEYRVARRATTDRAASPTKEPVSASGSAMAVCSRIATTGVRNRGCR